MGRRSGARAPLACACASPPRRRRSMQPRHGCGASVSRSPSLVRPHRGGVRAAPLLYIMITTLKNLGRERARDHERGTNAGSSRHGSHRRRLGGARAALRHRRRGRGLEARDGGLDPRRGRQRRRGALAPHAAAAAALDAAARFFTYIGMHPLKVRREVPGHLTDRLQEALWREILHMVNEDVATTGELDDSIVYGPGLRWAGMGTNLIYHLAGGE